MIIRIPCRFFVDHAERELPTPIILRETPRHVWIDTDDPAFAELMDDAKHYAHRDGPDQCPPGIITGAKALLKTVAKQTSPVR
jgi:hypothetical protein